MSDPDPLEELRTLRRQRIALVFSWLGFVIGPVAIVGYAVATTDLTLSAALWPIQWTMRMLAELVGTLLANPEILGWVFLIFVAPALVLRFIALRMFRTNLLE